MKDTEHKPPVPDFAKEVGRVAQRIRTIREISQTNGSFRFDVTRLMTRPKLSVTGTDDERVRSVLEGTVVSVEREFVLRGLEESDRTVVVEIKATYRIQYELEGPEAIPTEILQAASDLNSRFNLTAYWREYVHSCCARAGLPPYPVRPFNALHALAKLKAKSLPKTE